MNEVTYIRRPDGKLEIHASSEEALLRELTFKAAAQSTGLLQMLEREGRYEFTQGSGGYVFEDVFSTTISRLQVLTDAVWLMACDGGTDTESMLDVVFGKDKWLLADASQEAAEPEQEAAA